MPEYIPVTVDAARQIANAFQKHIVIIVTVDHLHSQTHFVTYGRYPEDKIIAAHLGEFIAQATGHDLSQTKSFEDFRHVDAAARAAENERLKELLRGVISRCEVAAIGGYVGQDGQYLKELKAAVNQ